MAAPVRHPAVADVCSSAIFLVVVELPLQLRGEGDEGRVGRRGAVRLMDVTVPEIMVADADAKLPGGGEGDKPVQGGAEGTTYL